MRIGCDIAQGFGIAKPMPSEDIPGWIDSFKPDKQWAIWADTKWEMSDFPLLVAQYDHINWVRRVLLSLEGKIMDANLTELTDHHECRFGHWYYEYGQNKYSHIAEFSDIEAIHVSVHQVGKKIVQLCHLGNKAQAELEAQKLLILKDKILEKMAALQQRVAKQPN